MDDGKLPVHFVMLLSRMDTDGITDGLDIDFVELKGSLMLWDIEM